MGFAATILLWLRSSRALYTITVLLPCCLGAAIAWYEGYPFSPGLLLLILLGMMFANIGTNFTNDYFDQRSGVDRIDEGRRFKRGAEVLLDNPLAESGSIDGYAAYFFSSRTILASAIGSFLVTTIVGAALAWRYDWRILPVGAAGIALGFFYTAPPLKLGYRGLGDLICFLGSGPLPVAGTHFLFAGRLSAASLLGGCFAGLLVDAILYIGNVPDAEADRRVGKTTLSTLLGRSAVRWLAPAYYAAAFGILVLAVAFGFFPAWSLLSLAAFPLVARIIILTRKSYDDVPRFAPAIMMTVRAFAAALVLLVGGLLLGRLVR